MSIGVSFIGDRLRIARLYRGLSLREVGEHVGVQPQFIASIEKNRRRPPPDKLPAIYEAVGFAPAWFLLPVRTSMDLESRGPFRKRTGTKRDRERVGGRAEVVQVVMAWLEEIVHFERDIPRIPAAATMDDIEEISQELRRRWQLRTDAPIMNVVRVIEQRAGVAISAYEDMPRSVDAMTDEGGVYPAIITGRKNRSWARERLSLLHELYHLLRKESGLRRDPDLEEQHAMWFAACFLMPAHALRREFPRMTRISWPTMFRLKKRWGVSLPALVKRGKHLGLLSPAQERSAYKYIGFKFGRKDEPDDEKPEHPELLKLAFSAVAKAGKSMGDAAFELGIDEEEICEIAGIPYDGEGVIDLKPRLPQSG